MTADRSVLVRLRANVQDYLRGIASARTATSGFVRDLDTADSRMSNIVQTALALAPALVPIGGAGVTAIAGLANQLGFAAAGAGSMVLGFQGVGDAMDALNKYQLEPTAANLEKAEQAFGKLSGAGGEFVLFLDEIEPKLRRLQRSAANGLLPGVQEGIDEFLTRTPQLRRIMTELADTTGDLFAEAGGSLASDRWDDFFDFLEHEARPQLVAFSKTVGNIFEGLANTWMAFDPLNDQFAGGFLAWSRDFAEATRNLDDNEGFQNFLAYVQRTGPQAAETLGDLVDMFAAFVAAAAPVGEATLPIIQAVAEVFESIAESPAGPVLIATAAGLSAVSRAVALYNAANGSAVAGFLGKVGGDGFKAQAGARAAAAGLGVFALSVTDLDDKVGLANTAIFAMMGAFAGPWGATLGAAAGAVVDARQANDGFTDSLERAQRILEDQPNAFQGQADALAQLRGEYDDFKSSITDDNLGMQFLKAWKPAALKNTIEGLFGDDDLEEGERKLEEFTRAMEVNFSTWERIANGLRREGGLIPKDFDDDLDGLANAATRIQPAMEALGLTAENMGSWGSPGWNRNIEAIRAWLEAADSVPGRSKLVSDALAEWGQDAESAADSADRLRGALDALFGPGLDQSAANDAWVESLQRLRETLKETDGQILGNSQAAQDYREALRDSIRATLDKVEADARVTDSGEQAAQTLLKERDRLIDMAVAAGVSKRDLEGLLEQMNLTPESLVTIVTTPGVLSSQEQVKALGVLYDMTPKEVRTLIGQLGMAKSQADIEALMEKYDLSRRDVLTLIKANADGAFATIDAVQDKLAGIKGKTVYVDVVTRSKKAVADGGLFAYAEGGMHAPSIGSQQPRIAPNQGPGGIVWAETGAGPWEAFVSGHPGKKQRSRSIADEVVSRLGGATVWFANGGFAGGEGMTPTSTPGGIVAGNMGDSSWGWLQILASAAQDAAKGVRDHKNALEDDRDSLRELRDARKDLVQAAGGSFDRSIFGEGLEGAFGTLEATRNDANAMTAALKKAKKLGLSGDAFEALAASGDLQTAQELDTKAEIRKFEKLMAQQQAAFGALGQFAGDTAFKAEIKDLRATVDKLDRTVKHLGRDVRDGAMAGTRDGARQGIGDRDRAGYGARGH